MRRKYGKATLDISADGCMGCGTGHAFGWSVAKIVKISIDGGAPVDVEIMQCDRCAAAKEATTLFAAEGTKP